MDSPIPYRVCEQHFLDLPGFDSGEYVRAFVSDTACLDSPDADDQIPHPDVSLEVGDRGTNLIFLFRVCTPQHRVNSLHKVDALIGALEEFRDGLAAEVAVLATREAGIEFQSDR